MDGMYYFHPENAPATHARNMPRWPGRAIDNTLAQLAPPRIWGRWVRSRRAGSPRATASCLPARVLSAQSAIAVPGRRQPPPPSSPTVSVSRGRRRKRSLPFSYSFFFWRDGHRRDCRSKHSKNEVPRSAKHASAEGHVRGDGDDDDALARRGRGLCRPRRQQRLTAAAFRLRLLPGCPQERLHEHPQVRGARVVPGAADVPCRRPTWRGCRPVLYARHHGRAGRQAVQRYAVHLHYGPHHVRRATPRPPELLHGERGRGSRQRGKLKCAGPRGPRLLPVS